jgi:hypothetical protein
MVTDPYGQHTPSEVIYHLMLLFFVIIPPPPFTYYSRKRDTLGHIMAFFSRAEKPSEDTNRAFIFDEYDEYEWVKIVQFEV